MSQKPSNHFAIAVVVLFFVVVVGRQLSCCSAATSTLRWAMTRIAVPGSAKVHRNGESKNKERSIDIKKILKVETGTGMFPGSSGTKGMLPAAYPYSSTLFWRCCAKSLHWTLSGCC